MPDSSEQGRRWTLTGIAFHGTGADRFATLPGIEPDLQRGEVVDVLPVSEHELVVQELRTRAERSERRVRETAALFGVCDGGRYWNDWLETKRLAEAEVERVAQERDRLRGELEGVRVALDWAKAPVSDEALDGIERVIGGPPRGYAPAGRVRALYSRERIEANRQRGRAESAEARLSELTEAARALVTETCREELGEERGYHRCNAPAEFVLWGRLIDPEGLGPRCYDHAAKHVVHGTLSRRLVGSNGFKLEAAIIDLRPLRSVLARVQASDQPEESA